MSEACFTAADILLPAAGVPLDPWACIAVDQFTSQPEYWQRAEHLADGKPSTLHIVLPEAYLGTPQEAERLESIRRTMEEYRKSVLTRKVHGYVYVERTQMDGTVRQGLVGAVDLDAYDYAKGSKPAIRPSESTVVERIPPRMKVRRGAALETPHVMMLADDPAAPSSSPSVPTRTSCRKVYEGELMLGGGHVRGWAVEGPRPHCPDRRGAAGLGSQEAFDAKYPDASGAKPLTLAVGDGNHSLAYRQGLLGGAEAHPDARSSAETHPARWCLAEVCNVHSPAIEIEPIHRVLFNVDCATVLLSLITWSDQHGRLLLWRAKSSLYAWQVPHMAKVLALAPARAADRRHHRRFLADYMPAHPGATVDYVHDEPAVRALCKQGAVAFLLPPFAKSDLFRALCWAACCPARPSAWVMRRKNDITMNAVSSAHNRIQVNYGEKLHKPQRCTAPSPPPSPCWQWQRPAGAAARA